MTQKDHTIYNHQKRINRIFEYIHEHLDEPLDLTTLSDIANLSPCHFHRVFKKMTGVSINQYTKSLKFERAVYCLSNTSENIYEIGRSLGYRSPASFCRAFKREFDISPGQYRSLTTSSDQEVVREQESS